MTERRVQRISFQVFEDEHPELFKAMQDLPASRIARRNALLRLLEAGLMKRGNATASSSEPGREEFVSPVHAPSSTEGVESQRSSSAVRSEEIVEEDLMELFP